jgi:RloB-like protein
VARLPISRVRGRDAFRRRPGQRQPRAITLVVCEGETEVSYFEAAREHYRLTSAEVVACNAAGSAPISVVEYAERRAAEQGSYDTIFCVFDRDQHESFARALDRIQSLARRSRNRLNIFAATSTPCFELWVLLHFERTDRPFAHCDEAVARIRGKHLPDYIKADLATSKRLLANVEVALANAAWLAGRRADTGGNPSTDVHLTIAHMKQVGLR